MANEGWHSKSISEVVVELGVSIDEGLSNLEALARLEKYGYNEIVVKKKRTPLRILLDQFANFLVIILIISTIISFVLGEEKDALSILAIVFLMAVLGFVQEYRAEKSIEALKKLASPKAKVIREGVVQVIPARLVVPGDIVMLEEGDRVPADARLVETVDLYVDESMLTGESFPVLKNANIVLPENTPLAERVNMVFMGTYVTRGRGKAVVTNTGMNTEMGRIAREISEAEIERTPLQKQLEILGRQIGMIILLITGVIFVTGLLMREGTVIDLLITSIALAVAAIPEGLPAIVTVILALGVWRLAKRNAIVRRLSAVETLGAATVICTDKTGTITKNEMTVRKILLGSGEVINVTGEGFSIEGRLVGEGGDLTVGDNSCLRLLLLGAILCNNANVRVEGSNASVVGDPLEASLLVLGLKAGMDVEEERKKYVRLKEIPFSSKRKRMTTVHKYDGRKIVFMKGAPEIVLELCDKIQEGDNVLELDYEKKSIILRNVEELAERALRVLAFAYKIFDDSDDEDIESNLIFLGIVGMMDPPRRGVREAVEKARRAGVKVVMVTGDHVKTAIAVGREIGLEVDKGIVLTGRDLDSLSDEELNDLIEDIVIFARVSPEHKSRIVKAYKSRGHIVAMTGDGVNDAPALKLADIGVAMGERGTDVAREAADMILADDNFVTIVNAIEEGRVIYDNIRKPIRYLLSCNIAEVLSIFLAQIIGLGLILKPIQILWMNLVTDSLPAAGLGVEPPEPGIMERPPRKPGERILTRRTMAHLALTGLIGGLLAILLYRMFEVKGVFYASTVAFSFLVFFQLLHSLNCKSESLSLLKVGVLSNKYLLLSIFISWLLQLMAIYVAPWFFETVYLSITDFMAITLFGAVIILVEELRKAVGVTVK